MQEIWIPELLITLFLFLYIIRPYVKKLFAIDGLAWLPLLALLITVILIPAYGFRPETLALLIYAAVLTVISIVKKAGNDSKFRDFREAKLIFALPPLLILAAAAWLAFFFSPQAAHGMQGAYAQETIKAGDREYLIRVYTDQTDKRPSERPLILILPPTLGSLDVIDLVSEELSGRGFTVLAFSGRNSGAQRTEWLDYIHAFFSGTVSAKANKKGRALEYKRREDLLSLLSWIRQNPRLEGNYRLFDIASRNSVFLLGYDAGGSALILTENSLPLTLTTRSVIPGTAAEEIKVLGIIAVESYLWSLYREEVPEIPPLPPEAGWFHTVQHDLKCRFLEMKPKKITGQDRIPETSIPLLLLDSGVHNDAGPLDYSDFPVKYPLITALLRGSRKQTWKNSEAPARTAEIVASFAASLPKEKDPPLPGIQFGDQFNDQPDIQGDIPDNAPDKPPFSD